MQQCYLWSAPSRASEARALVEALDLSIEVVTLRGSAIDDVERTANSGLVLLMLSGNELPSNATAAAKQLASISARRQSLFIATPPVTLDACDSSSPRSALAARIRDAALSPASHVTGLMDFEAALLPMTNRFECKFPSELALDVMATMVRNRLSGLCDHRVSPPSTTVPAVAPRVLTAVCFGGWVATARGIADGGESIRRHLLTPLADTHTLLALHFHGAADCRPSRQPTTATSLSSIESLETSRAESVAQSCVMAVRRGLHAIGPIHRLRLEPTPTMEEEVQMLERLPHWARIVHAFNSGTREPGIHNPRPKVCTRDPVWKDRGTSPYRCTNVWGSYLSPIFASDASQFGHNFIVLRDVSRCLGLVHSAERHGGFRYTHVVTSRLDFTWFAPHPPLPLLASAVSAWIPEGSDFYGGINDRHAVLSRAAAEMVMTRYRPNARTATHARPPSRAEPSVLVPPPTRCRHAQV